MKKPDLGAMQGKPLKEVAKHAENLAHGELEERLHAHAIFSSILEQLPSSEDQGLANARVALTSKIWLLEKSFYWNERYYSQAGQDKRIKEAFFKNCKGGFFVEIGAFNGVTGSNCLHFEKFMEWDGVAVEPAKTQFAFLQKNRQCQTINKAVGYTEKVVNFIEVTQGLSMLSGVDSESYDPTKSLVENDSGSRTVSYPIETVSVMDIVNGRPEIDFMSIDVEGAELQVLDSIDFNSLSIRVIAIENSSVGSSVFRQFFECVGYQYFDTIGHDEIYFNPQRVRFSRD